MQSDIMTSLEVAAPDTEQSEHQLERVLQSATFRNSPTLQQLLRFLGARSLSGSAELLKEYTIGVEALGRREDFDPKVDPIVRVQSHRLRVKLREYYELEGSQDPILIQIPRGHYLPSFELVSALSNSAVPSVESTPLPEAPAKAAPPEQAPVKAAAAWWRNRKLALAIAFASVAAVAFWLGRIQVQKQVAGNLLPAAVSSASGSAQAFWARFLGADRNPVIVYPDAVFLLDDSNDLFRFRRGASDGRGAVVDEHLARQFASNSKLVSEAGQLYYENGYTGTGELQAAAMLAALFGRMGITPTVKSSRDLTPDDLDQHNVILLGSTFQNIAVAQLMTGGDFSFQNPDQKHEQWRGLILDSNPMGNEQKSYGTERDPTTRVLTTDFSLISIAPGVVPGRYIAFLGGLDTKGTQGATMFATSNFGVEQLNRALRTQDSGSDPHLFQALVRVRLAKGYQVLGTELVTVHPQTAAHPAQQSGSPKRP